MVQDGSKGRRDPWTRPGGHAITCSRRGRDPGHHLTAVKVSRVAKSTARLREISRAEDLWKMRRRTMTKTRMRIIKTKTRTTTRMTSTRRRMKTRMAITTTRMTTRRMKTRRRMTRRQMTRRRRITATTMTRTTKRMRTRTTKTRRMATTRMGMAFTRSRMTMTCQV